MAHVHRLIAVALVASAASQAQEVRVKGSVKSVLAAFDALGYKTEPAPSYDPFTFVASSRTAGGPEGYPFFTVWPCGDPTECPSVIRFLYPGAAPHGITEPQFAAWARSYPGVRVVPDPDSAGYKRVIWDVDLGATGKSLEEFRSALAEWRRIYKDFERFSDN